MALRLQGKPAEPSRRLFGTDGIRGVANVYPMTGELMLQLGRALAFLIKNGPHRHRVVIGKDTRLSGYMLETALASGLCSMGVDGLLCGARGGGRPPRPPPPPPRTPHPDHPRGGGGGGGAPGEPQSIPGQWREVLR